MENQDKVAVQAGSGATPVRSADRVTQAPPGLAVDPAAELSATDQSVMQSVQEAIERRPGPRMPRSRRPAPVAPMDLPFACKGEGCQTRDQIKQIIEKCKGDRACYEREIARRKLQRGSNGNLPAGNNGA